MENKQTAVEFAIEQLEKLIPSGNQAAIFVINEKAKQMEKEQIINAYYRGVRNEWEGIGKDFEDFYNETYGEAQ